MLPEFRLKKKKKWLEQSNPGISAILEEANNTERQKDKTLKKKLEVFMDRSAI